MIWMDLLQQISILDVGTWMSAHSVHSMVWDSLDLNWFQHLGSGGQQFDTDVFRGTRTLLNRFVQSGQLWAFLIGLAAGYLLRAVTTYG